MLKSGIYNIIGEVFRKVLALAAIPVLLDRAGVEEYGLWAIASAIINLFALPEGGLGIAATVAVSRDLAGGERERLSQTLTSALFAMAALGAALATILLAFAGPLSHIIPNLSNDQQENVTWALRAGSAMVFARIVQQIFIGIEQSTGHYGLLNTLTAFQAIASNAGIMVVAVLGGRTAAMIQLQAAVAVTGMLAHAIASWILLRKNSPKWNWDTARLWEFVIKSAWTCLTTLGAAIFSQADKVVVGRILGVSVAGTYDAITKLTGQINTFSGLTVQPLLPDMSGRLANIELERTAIVARLKQASQINALSALWLGAAMYVLAPEILRLMLRHEGAPAVIQSFRIAIVIYSIYSLNAVGYFLLLAMDAVKATSIIVLVGAVLSIALIWFGAEKYELLGAVSGNAGFLCIILLTILAMQRVRIPASEWISWWLVPLLWFSGTVAATYCCSEQLAPRVGIIAAATLAITTWLIKVEKTIGPALLNSAVSKLENR